MPSYNELEGFTWCKFGHVTPPNARTVFGVLAGLYLGVLEKIMESLGVANAGFCLISSSSSLLLSSLELSDTTISEP